MFDRFTDECRKAVKLALANARELKHDEIRPEHVLYGLVESENSASAQFLIGRGIADALRERVVPGGKSELPRQLPFTPESKKSLELALEEAACNGHRWIATPHLLAGLLRLDGGPAPEVLASCGIRLEEVRASLREIKPRQTEGS